MTRRILAGSSVVVALLLVAPVFGASIRDPRIERLAVEDGLPDGTVYSATQDASGFVWFGTENGLARYDGHGFTVYTHDPGDPWSISSSQASHAYVDREQRLWIGTWGGGLERYDPAIDGFRHYPHRPGRADGLADSRVQALLEDRTGELWIGFLSGGLQRLDPSSGELRSFRHDPEDPATLSHDRIWSIAQDATGALWLGTSAGLDRLDPETGRVTRRAICPTEEPCLPQEEVRALLADRRGGLWIGTRAGLVRAEPDGDLRVFHSGEHGLVDDMVNTIFEDRSGRVWVGTMYGGVHLWEPDRQRFRSFRHEVDNPNSLSYDDVRCLFEDRSGLLWIGTRGEGVSKLDPRSHFTRYRFDPADRERSLSHQRVWSVVTEGPDRIWVGTQAGLDRIERNREEVLHTFHDPGRPSSLSSGDVRVLHLDRDGDLWVATNAGGLDRLLTEDREAAELDFRHFSSSIFDGGVVRAIVDGPRGHLWVATSRGIHVVDRRTGGVRRHLRESVGDGLGSDDVRALLFDHRGLLWIGTLGAGVERFDPATGTFARFANDPADPTTLSRSDVLALHQDRGGTIWVGTLGGGLNRHDDATGSFRRYTTKDGLASNVVHAILEDGQGHLWLSTNLGLSRFDPVTESFRSFGVSDGLQGSSFLRGAAHRASSGELLFGGTSGLNAFDPAEIVDSPFVPPIRITAVRLFGELIEGWRPGSESPSVQLDPDDDYLTIEFAALDYSKPERNRYAYRLDGFDREWIEAGSRREAHYTNLEGGDYTFRVRGSNPDGVWNEEGASLRIRVVPALAERTWFRTVMLLGALLLVGIAVHFRLLGAQRAQRRLEALVRTRTAELEAKTGELERAYRRAEEISFTDPLTGLRNRRYLDQMIEPDVARTLREHGRWLREGTGERPEGLDLLFVLVDLDRFKSVNDSLGHRSGDQVLAQLGQLFRTMCRESDLVIRWGGEEFLLLSRFIDRDRAPIMVERIRRSVESHPFRLDDGEVVHLSCSAGFAAFPFAPEHPQILPWDQVLELADHALYEAKRIGRNTWAGIEIGAAGGEPDLGARIRRSFELELARGGLEWIRRPVGQSAVEEVPEDDPVLKSRQEPPPLTS